ncbi:sialin-like [Octopus sinensis]|uniref:Sialin-like n=1 Tax=Octopus sinensis TaxID=2607531 RepID=A0A6P7TUT5_9MOLL|nr:sialin-like [Octopus sinensis]
MFDYILRKHTITKIKLRKILNIFCSIKCRIFIGLFPTGLFFMFATLISPSQYQFGIFLLLIASFFSGFEVVVSMPNIGDIAPQYTGIIFGFVNTIATVAGICSIQSSYLIVSDTHKPREWQILFGILIIIQVLGFIIFTMWGEGTIQKWAIPKEKTVESELKTNL